MREPQTAAGRKSSRAGWGHGKRPAGPHGVHCLPSVCQFLSVAPLPLLQRPCSLAAASPAPSLPTPNLPAQQLEPCDSWPAAARTIARAETRVAIGVAQGVPGVGAAARRTGQQPAGGWARPAPFNGRPGAATPHMWCPQIQAPQTRGNRFPSPRAPVHPSHAATQRLAAHHERQRALLALHQRRGPAGEREKAGRHAGVEAGRRTALSTGALPARRSCARAGTGTRPPAQQPREAPCPTRGRGV